MNEKPESEEFDEDEEEVAFEATSEVDFDRLAKDLDAAKKRGQKLGDPAWRRLERRFEDKHTAELTSDFDDYEIDDDSTAVRRMNSQKTLLSRSAARNSCGTWGPCCEGICRCRT